MSDRQRLEAIVDVTVSYLVPDGISAKEAMSRIILLADPLPENDELRRLHEVNQELVEALERLTSAANDVDDGYLTDAINQAEAALAKQQEKRNEYTTRARK